MQPDKTALRDAATILVIRHDAPGGPAVLMGQRGAGAAFMPSKFVFPGGAVDPGDAGVPHAGPLPSPCAARLAEGGGDAAALFSAALREMWEETGLRLSAPGTWPGPVPPDWQAFARGGHLPAPQGLTYIFRAITPPGRPRRFDARFFVADAAHLTGDPHDFSMACEELSHLHWVPMAEARKLDLPFITEVVLAEAMALADRGAPPESVPFFDNSGDTPAFRRIA
jgi:8-oxo-dGTP pyrophosphatase MutT (NUDIX family)